MDRRYVLQLASVGVMSSVAGCLGSFENDDSSDSSQCDLTPFDQFDRSWSHMKGGPTSARRVDGDGVTTDGELDQQTLHEFETSQRVEPLFASPETICCRVTHMGDDDTGTHTGNDDTSVTYTFVDTNSGDERWQIDAHLESPAGDLEPPDGTTAHGSISVSPHAIADGLVYVTTTYEPGEESGIAGTLSGGVFALDATDGSVEWSRASRPSTLYLDREGSLYATGYSDALVRADPDERQSDDGEWTLEPGTDERLHAQALNARTGESCWEWDVESPDPDAGAMFRTRPHGIGEHVLVSFVHNNTEQPNRLKTELFRIDADTGDDHDAIEFVGPPTNAVEVDGRLVLGTLHPPTDDAPTDGATLFAIDLSRGKIDWMVSPPSEFPQAATDDVVVCGGDPIVGIDPATGETEWEADSSAEVACIAGETLVTYTSESPEIQLRELETGDLIASTPLDDFGLPDYSRMIGAGDQFFFTGETEHETRLVALT